MDVLAGERLVAAMNEARVTCAEIERDLKITRQVTCGLRKGRLLPGPEIEQRLRAYMEDRSGRGKAA